MLREKAKAFLNAASSQSLPDELAKRDAEIALLKEQMAKLIPPNAAPQVTAPSPSENVIPSPAVAAQDVPIKRKRGRPTNAEIAARVAAQAGLK
jgi:hypothetical protein